MRWCEKDLEGRAMVDGELFSSGDRSLIFRSGSEPKYYNNYYMKCNDSKESYFEWHWGQLEGEEDQGGTGASSSSRGDRDALESTQESSIGLLNNKLDQISSFIFQLRTREAGD